MTRGSGDRPLALFLRALTSVLVLPGTVAFLIPLMIVRQERAADVSYAGIPLLLIGSSVLLWCVVGFYVHGRGTLAPWDPPRSLVVSGLYRFSRNPMYVGVQLVLVGWAVLFRSMTLAGYAALMGVIFHVRVVLFEEPWLAQTFPDAWRQYSSRVRRWL